jgi:hypothetical protein
MPRPTPFDLVFTGFAQDRFPRIRAALDAGGRDAADRDAFLIEREAVLLLHELRPEEGLGEGIDQLAALLHHAYLFWEAGLPTVSVAEHGLAVLLNGGAPSAAEPADAPRSMYVEIPERRMWAVVMEGEPPEPLEGCFIHTASANELRVLGVFGLRPERMGFSVVETAGPRPASLARLDGSELFAPAMAGGAAAGLYSLVGSEELLELGWRGRALAAESLVGAGRWTR